MSRYYSFTIAYLLCRIAHVQLLGAIQCTLDREALSLRTVAKRKTIQRRAQTNDKQTAAEFYERERERKRAGRARALVCYGRLTGLLSSSCPCPPLVLVLAAPLNSVAGLCVRVLSSSCPCLGRAPELCGWSLWPGLLERSVAEQIAMLTPTKIH